MNKRFAGDGARNSKIRARDFSRDHPREMKK
jgi:hypothetical protein